MAKTKKILYSEELNPVNLNILIRYTRAIGLINSYNWYSFDIVDLKDLKRNTQPYFSYSGILLQYQR